MKQSLLFYFDPKTLFSLSRLLVRVEFVGLVELFT